MISALFSRHDKPAVAGVHLYFSADMVVVAAIHQNLDGIYVEQPTPLVMRGDITQQRLGAAFSDAFQKFSIQDRSLRGMKREDWPAFRASGVRSVTQFVSAFRAVQCYGLHPSNAIVRAATAHPVHEDIELSVAFNPLLGPEAIGEKLLQLVRAADAIRPAVQPRGPGDIEAQSTR